MSAIGNTAFALDLCDLPGHPAEMLTAAEILVSLKARGVTQAEIGKTIGLAQPNVATLYTPGKNGKLRQLKYDEGLALIEKFRLPTEEADAEAAPLPSGRAFEVLLGEVLKRSAAVTLPASTVRPTAEALRLSLELLSRNPAIHDSPDAIKAIVDAAASRPPAAKSEA